jgi:uncharacterized protein YhaN
MRLTELKLLKYGRFDGCDLHFPLQTPDLQIIYGPNEAGKSTTMSAISDLLFGFPHITHFDFRHDKQLLRVGAVLDADGEPIAFRRKKGRTGTLLDSEDRVLDEGRLSALLAGYTADSFQRMFSLDHGRLRQGGEAILQAEDDIGQAIFAAGSGLVGVARLLEALEADARAVWTKRVGNTSYHLAYKAFEDAKSRLKAAQMKPAAWDEMRLNLARLEEKLADLRKHRTALDLDREKIERHRRVLPPAALYRQAAKELEDLGVVVDLPADAAAIQQQALAATATAKTQAGLADTQAKELRATLDGLVLNTAVLDRGQEIDELREAKGAVDKALADLPRRNAELTTRSAHLAELQREVGWPEEPAKVAKGRLPERVRLADARSLLEERNGLDRLLSSAEDEHTARRQDLDELERQRAALPAARDVASLAEALRFARSRGDLDAAVALAQREADRKSEVVETSLAQLTPRGGEVATLHALSAPSDREAAEAVAALSQADEALAQAGRDLCNAKDRLAVVELQRKQLVRDERAVSFDVVTSTRTERDATWGQLRAHIVDGAELSNPRASADQFEEQSAAADEVSDQRFVAAAQSGRLAGLEEEIERIALAISQHERQIVEAQAEVDRVAREWRAALAPSGLDLTPKAYTIWAERRSRVLDAATAAAEATAALDATTTRRTETASLLGAALQGADPSASARTDSFGLLLQTAESLYAAEDAATKRRDELRTQTATATTALARAELKRSNARQGITDWETKWSSVVVAVGLDPRATLAVIRARLDLLEETRGEIEAILELERRTTAMQSDIDDFDSQVRVIAAACGVTDPSGTAADILIGLARAASEAKTLAERRAGLEQQLFAAETHLQSANDARELAKAGLRPLMEASRAEDDAALAAAIARSDKARALREDLNRLADEIVKAGGGPLLEALLDEVRDAEADALKVQSGDLQDALRTLSDEIEAKAAERATVQAEFARFDDGPDAAIAAADMEQAKAEMAAQAEAYVRKRAEVNLLRWAIDRYRAEKQTPLLKRASALFSILTRGNYVSLLVDAEGSKARLSGLDRNDAVVPVDRMSEGTVDQLFLALRLAAVEDAVAGGAKLPFLADDLFVNYDDERALVGFEVLAELAKSTQVLFFTHHRHLLGVAESALGASRVAFCELT